MKFYEEYHYNEGQALFDKTISGLQFAFILFLRILVYLPLIITGWFITTTLLNKTDSVFLWISLTGLFSWLLYFAVYFLKGMIIALRVHHKWLWVPLFLCCTLFAVALPVYVSYDFFLKIMPSLHVENMKLITSIFSAAFGLYVYSKYSFLTNIAPRAAYPYYQMGINITVHLLKLATKIKAGKSKVLI